MTCLKHPLRSVLAILGMAMLVPALLLMAFDSGALDRAFHQKLYDALGSSEAAGVDEKTLSEIGDMLTDYLNGERSGLDMTAEVNGAVQKVFNEREIAHMQDVRALFQMEQKAARLLFWMGAVLLLGAVPGRDWAKRLLRAGLIGQIFWLALLLFAAVWAAADFNGVFLRFHALLFTNDLWLLNPETDLMIRMLPEKFFAAVAVHAAGRMLTGQALLAALWGLPVLIARRMNRKSAV